MDRAEAAAEIDQYLEWFNTMIDEGRCPKCEAVQKRVDVDAAEVPESAKREHGDLPEGWSRMDFDHADGCPLGEGFEHLRRLAEPWGFKFAWMPYERVVAGELRTFLHYERAF